MRKAYLIAMLAVGMAFSAVVLAAPASAQISVGISVRVGPPPLPVYAQPVCPGDNYIWTPGYWAWSEGGYYWVPGTWVLAPEPGLLWTPGWWGFSGGAYLWHPGYWGPHVGFYGGINYGYGYFGEGFVGGRWQGGRFAYNRAVTNVNIRIVHNVYVNRSYRRMTNSRVAYNGGPRGVNARPTPEQRRWDSERHVGRTSEQDRHDMQARNDRSLHYSNNHGRPPIAATQRPGQFSGRGAVRPGERPNNQSHPPANQNGARENYRAQPNTRGRENQQARPTNREPARQTHAAPPNRGNEARPHNEQPHGNAGGERGHGGGGGHDGGHDGGGHGHDNGR